MDVIIPVKNMESQLADCLTTVLSQLDADDRLVVVDDASTDSTRERAEELGADVLAIEVSQGPYGARHVAAMQSKSESLLFIDGRSRALPGLVAAHKTMLSRPGIALSCTQTHTRSGPTLAARIAAIRQPFALQQYVGNGRLDFFPTCNLGVSTDSYRAVGGFRNMRSGGDADLCWRIQQQGLGTLATDARALMEWVPRDRLRDLMEQYYRYGKSTRYLEWVYPNQSPKREGRGIQLRTVFARRGVETLTTAAYAAGLMRAVDQQAPQYYEINPVP